MAEIICLKGNRFWACLRAFLVINRRKSWRFRQEEQGERVFGEYECIGEENEDGESKGVAAWKFEGEKEENVGLFVKLKFESY